MNELLREILSTGHVISADGSERKPVHSHLSEEEGRFVQDLIKAADPTIVVEIGLAYAVSALYICAALNVRDDTRYIAIDPNQSGGEWGHDWEGIGHANLDRAGHGHFVEVINKPSFQALPELVSEGVCADFGFIDGWHTFDYALLDFFFLDRILRVGGIIAIDDTHWPAVRKVCRFIASNRSYSVIGKVGDDNAPSWKRTSGARLLKKTPLARHLRPEFLTSDRELGIDGTCVAFRKVAHDERHWADYHPF